MHYLVNIGPMIDNKYEVLFTDGELLLKLSQIQAPNNNGARTQAATAF